MYKITGQTKTHQFNLTQLCSYDKRRNNICTIFIHIVRILPCLFPTSHTIYFILFSIEMHYKQFSFQTKTNLKKYLKFPSKFAEINCKEDQCQQRQQFVDFFLKDSNDAMQNLALDGENNDRNKKIV